MALNIDFICAASLALRYLTRSIGPVRARACGLRHETIGALSLRDVDLHIPNTLPKQTLISPSLLSALCKGLRSYSRHQGCLLHNA